MTTLDIVCPKVLMVATQDTKEDEARFIRECLEGAGCHVVHIDPSVRKTIGGAEIGPDDIAAAAGSTMEQVRLLGHESKCQEVMIKGAMRLTLDLFVRERIAGILAVGGSMGTTFGTALMRALPYGLPKMMISTMGSGFTQPFVGLKDIAMLNAVCDISGLNSISRSVFRNGAFGLAGMAKEYQLRTDDHRPLVLISTLGTTENVTRNLRRSLEAEGFEVMVFHTLGNGGRTLDAIAAEWNVAAIVDLSLVELNDHLNNGLCSAGPDRATAGVKRGIPTIFAPGNADFIVAGPLAIAAQQFPGKRLHQHNVALTAVRTQEPELRALADHLAGIMRQATGPVRFYIPLKGFSHHDSPMGHIHDPSLPPIFAAYVKSVMPANVDVRQFDHHINDVEFAEALATAVCEMARGNIRTEHSVMTPHVAA